MDMNFQRD